MFTDVAAAEQQQLPTLMNMHGCHFVQPGDYVSMTNVHAMVHKWTDADPVDHGVPMVELCIHGGGSEKYSRGLSVVDDSLPAVQRLKLLLDECTDDDDHGGPEEERLSPLLPAYTHY